MSSVGFIHQKVRQLVQFYIILLMHIPFIHLI